MMMKIILRLRILSRELFAIFVLITVLEGCTPKQDKQPVPERWYRNAIIYNLDVDSYQDSDGDGKGDFKGLINRLGYLKSLGVDVIWLSPFQPTPDRDDGYDISDYYAVDSTLGKMSDFENFIAATNRLKIHVIMDVVLNHTSIEHPWFQKARSGTAPGFKNRYLWRSSRPDDAEKGMAFPGVQEETWTYDEVAKAYYFHRFYNFQPDLNYQNKDVQKEAGRILQFWQSKGIKGFRLDAVPFIIDEPTSSAKDPGHMFGVLDSIVRGAKQKDPDVLLLGEANVETKENTDYFGNSGDRLSMMFNFYANQYLFYALAIEKPGDFLKALEQTKDKPAASQWAFFLRNHDEIDLGRLSGPQRKRVYKAFGPEKNMQLYQRGIRRRLASMLHNELQLRMAYSLLYSLPGTPVIRSGEEIGMGDDLTQNERMSVRTPMQWNESRNAGFSSSPHPFRPVISLGEYGYAQVNVYSEVKNSHSLLNYIRKLIALHKKYPLIGNQNWETLQTGDASVMAVSYSEKTNKLITVHNFSGSPASYSFTEKGQFVDLLSGRQIDLDKGKIRIEGYGCLWLVKR
jgi:maltose alpha-D-glucosyltransferase/alpha-amylase